MAPELHAPDYGNKPRFDSNVLGAPVVLKNYDLSPAQWDIYNNMFESIRVSGIHELTNHMGIHYLTDLRIVHYNISVMGTLIWNTLGNLNVGALDMFQIGIAMTYFAT